MDGDREVYSYPSLQGKGDIYEYYEWDKDESALYLWTQDTATGVWGKTKSSSTNPAAELSANLNLFNFSDFERSRKNDGRGLYKQTGVTYKVNGTEYSNCTVTLGFDAEGHLILWEVETPLTETTSKTYSYTLESYGSTQLDWVPKEANAENGEGSDK